VPGKFIQAAGGIVIRGDKRPLFAVVQRSKDDKWVLPRGKLKTDENPVAGARREVVEETGHRVAVNEFLGAITYRAGGRAKVVQFWQMQAEDEASHELMADIVAVEWLPLKAAVRRLSYPLEKLFLRNVGRRAAKPRKGRASPGKIAGKAANHAVAAKPGKKSSKKATRKAAKKAGKKARRKSAKRGGNKAKRKGKKKPAARKPVAAVPAKVVSAAKREGLLQRMLGRLGA
jgi:8-oxo-dGTP diphosphatase